MAVRWAITGGSWSNISTWNDGATLGIPTSADDVFTNGFTINMDVNATVLSLNNTARGRDITTPLMSANNIPTPYVAASSSQTGSQFPYLAFDRNYNTLSNYWNSAGSTGWISIDYGLGNTIIIDGYTIFGYTTPGFNPNTWQFQGSNDNVNWTTLHSVVNSTIPANGTYSVSSIGNTTPYRYYRVNITANGGNPTITIVELELYRPNTISLSAGGSFNFNTPNVTVNVTSNLGYAGGTFFQVTATSGIVTISTPSVNWIPPAFTTFLTHTGNCNLTVTAISFQGQTGGASANSGVCISKSSSGLLTVNGNVLGRGGFRNNGNYGIISTNGNTIINGNVTGGLSSSTASLNRGIDQSSGTLVINGNIFGGQGNTSDAVYFRGTLLTINGNVFTDPLAGSGNYSVNTTSVTTITGNVAGGQITGAQAIGTTNNLTINGNVSGGTVGAIALLNANITNITGNLVAETAAPISSSFVHTLNITGNTIASATANAISLTNASSQVYLNGNMFNVNGKMAIYAPIVWLDQTGTTQSRFFTSGGADRTLYSDNIFPNQPSVSDVRYLTQFGPSSGLTGTLRIASPSDVRSGVATDNTVGTALFDTSQLLAELNASSDPIAQRLRKVATPEILGQLLAAYKK